MARLAAAFFVNADGQKVDEAVTTWKSKSPRFFRNVTDRDLSRPLGVHYLMNSEIMSEVLEKLDCKMKIQNKNVLLFIYNATSHQESIEKNLPNIKLVFLPKITTCRNN